MSLSKDFTKKELTRTDTGLPNVPKKKEEQFLKLLAVFIVQPIRDRWGRYKTNSAFRCPAVNNHKDVQGSSTGQHPLGQAHDGRPMEADVFEVYKWIVKESGIQFGSCIIYPERKKPFIHISLPRINKANGQALINYKGKYLVYSEDLLQEILKELRG